MIAALKHPVGTTTPVRPADVEHCVRRLLDARRLRVGKRERAAFFGAVDPRAHDVAISNIRRWALGRYERVLRQKILTEVSDPDDRRCLCVAAKFVQDKAWRFVQSRHIEQYKAWLFDAAVCGPYVPPINLTRDESAVLVRSNVMQAGLTQSEAKDTLNEISARSRQGLCTFKQARLLEKHGLRSDLTADVAAAVINRICENGWKVQLRDAMQYGKSQR